MLHDGAAVASLLLWSFSIMWTPRQQMRLTKLGENLWKHNWCLQSYNFTDIHIYFRKCDFYWFFSPSGHTELLRCSGRLASDIYLMCEASWVLRIFLWYPSSWCLKCSVSQPIITRSLRPSCPWTFFVFVVIVRNTNIMILPASSVSIGLIRDWISFGSSPFIVWCQQKWLSSERQEAIFLPDNNADNADIGLP